MHPPGFRMDHRLSDWPDCYIELGCHPCGGRIVIVSVKVLAGGIGDCSFQDVLCRLRCERCRKTAAPVYLCASQHRVFLGGPEADWSIELVAPPRKPRPVA